MTTKTKAEDIQLALDTFRTVHELITESGGLLVVTVKSTSRSNMSFNMDIRLYYEGNYGVTSIYLNWAYAKLKQATQNKHGEVRWSSLGTDRAFEVSQNVKGIFSSLGLEDVTVRYEGVY